MRLLFTSDVHGSTAVLEKVMAKAVERAVDLLIVCGDLQGKYLLFIEEDREHLLWEDPVDGTRRRAPRKELPEIQRDIASCGGYAVLVARGWDPAQQPDEALEHMLTTRSLERLGDWMSTLRQFQAKHGIQVMMMPGNDDDHDFDRVIQDASEILFLEERVHEAGGYRFGGLATVPPTPWRTPREASEDEISRQLDRLFRQGRPDLPFILVAHSPPYSTGIDMAPMLDRNLKQVVLGGVLQFSPVGSHSVRAFLEANRTIPLALHGHIHEADGWARVGDTLCLNPGTEYFNGMLVAHLVELDHGRVVHYERVRS